MFNLIQNCRLVSMFLFAATGRDGPLERDVVLLSPFILNHTVLVPIINNGTCEL